MGNEWVVLVVGGGGCLRGVAGGPLLVGGQTVLCWVRVGGSVQQHVHMCRH